MNKKKNSDQFFNFLLDQIDNPKEKAILEIIKKYPSKNKSRKLIKEGLAVLKSIKMND